VTGPEGLVSKFESVEVDGKDLTIVLPWDRTDVTGVVTLHGAVQDDGGLSGNWTLTDRSDVDVSSGSWKASRRSEKTESDSGN
jgi:hypothetical protein